MIPTVSVDFTNRWGVPFVSHGVFHECFVVDYHVGNPVTHHDNSGDIMDRYDVRFVRHGSSPLLMTHAPGNVQHMTPSFVSESTRGDGFHQICIMNFDSGDGFFATKSAIKFREYFHVTVMFECFLDTYGIQIGMHPTTCDSS